MRFALLALFVTAAPPLAAQPRLVAPAPSRLFAVEAGAPRVAATVDTVPKPAGDHRWTGAVIGGVAGGGIGYLFDAYSAGGNACPASGGCSDGTGTSPWGTIGGVALGATVGYFLGRATTKGGLPDTPPPGPVPEDTGLTPAQGAGIGALVGAAVFAYWASVSEGGDGGVENVLFIPFGALLGAFIGGGLARE